MSEEIKLVVEGYLSLKDRSAIEEMRAPATEKATWAAATGSIDAGATTEALDKDLRVI